MRSAKFSVFLLTAIWICFSLLFNINLILKNIISDFEKYYNYYLCLHESFHLIFKGYSHLPFSP